MQPSETPVPQRHILHRLHRAAGQLMAVSDRYEDGTDARETVQQLAAVSKAVCRAACLILAEAVKVGLIDEEISPRTNGDERLSTTELERFFLMLT
jgi:DNA-binding FrmR family transcriptional regulator